MTKTRNAPVKPTRAISDETCKHTRTGENEMIDDASRCAHGKTRKATSPHQRVERANGFGRQPRLIWCGGDRGGGRRGHGIDILRRPFKWRAGQRADGPLENLPWLGRQPGQFKHTRHIVGDGQRGLPKERADTAKGWQAAQQGLGGQADPALEPVPPVPRALAQAAKEGVQPREASRHDFGWQRGVGNLKSAVSEVQGD